MTPEKHDISPLLNMSMLKGKDLSGQKVLVRLDLNIPMVGDKVLDTSRLDASLPTLKRLLEAGATLIILTHRGRPKGIDLSLSTRSILPLLQASLQQNVMFAHTVEELKEALLKNPSQKIILLENIRFFEEETTKNDPKKIAFAQSLHALADFYMNDAFSVSHRTHMSVHTLPLCFKKNHRYAGVTFEKEVNALNTILQQSHNSTLITLLGGGKVSTKIGLLKHLLKISQYVILGGGMANTFLTAIGAIPKSKSLFEEDFLKEAHDLYAAHASKIILPMDAVVIDETANPTTLPLNAIHPNHAIVDIGPETLKIIRKTLSKTAEKNPNTIILWNGPFGWIENPPFDQGSTDIATILAECTKNYHATTIVGGGETLSCLRENKDHITFASTAGGAFLEYLEKGTLPGVEVLKKI